MWSAPPIPWPLLIGSPSWDSAKPALNQSPNLFSPGSFYICLVACSGSQTAQTCFVSATTTLASASSQKPTDLEPSVRLWGEKIFSLMDKAEPPSLFTKKGFYGTLMDWAMRDDHFKTQLFRFVDVLPTLTSSSEIARHLQEYLGDEQVKLSPALRMGLKAAGGASWLLGAGVKSQVTGMARQFMLGDDPKEIAATLRKLAQQDIAFTADILGEAVVSEVEADQYTQRYLDLMDFLAADIPKWPHAS